MKPLRMTRASSPTKKYRRRAGDRADQRLAFSHQKRWRQRQFQASQPEILLQRSHPSNLADAVQLCPAAASVAFADVALFSADPDVADAAGPAAAVVSVGGYGVDDAGGRRHSSPEQPRRISDVDSGNGGAPGRPAGGGGKVGEKK